MTPLHSHPAAALFPLLPDKELVNLAVDIQANGQRLPIIVNNGVIIDGRNRYRACQVAGVDPLIEEMEFPDENAVVAFIVSANIHRRHLTESQRAIIAAELAKLEHGSNQHQAEDASIEASTPVFTQAKAAETMQVSRSSVQRAKTVANASPELAEKVKKGVITLNKAHQQVRPMKAETRIETPESLTSPDLSDPHRLLVDRGISALEIEVRRRLKQIPKRAKGEFVRRLRLLVEKIESHVEADA